MLILLLSKLQPLMALIIYLLITSALLFLLRVKDDLILMLCSFQLFRVIEITIIKRRIVLLKTLISINLLNLLMNRLLKLLLLVLSVLLLSLLDCCIC